MSICSPPSTLDSLWVLPLFIVMWLIITGMLSRMGGWYGLAEKFRATHGVSGQRFRFASASLGVSLWMPVNYSGCLFLTVADSGLHMRLLFLFRFLSPPLFIPWSAVESVTEQRIWFIRRQVISIRGTQTRLMVAGRTGQVIAQRYHHYSSVHR
jgi:hypothetical protein